MVEQLETIPLRVKGFRSMLDSGADVLTIVRRRVLHGAPYALSEDDAYGVARDVAEYWDVHPNRDVFVVGSAQLGFSISPNKRWKPFGDTSDIDVAVVSDRLFERYWEDVDRYAGEPTSWANRDRCKLSLASGWLRPDLLPGSMASDWFEFFRTLQRDQRYGGGIKIAAGIYYSMGFLERYQSRAVRLCRGAEAQ